MGVLSGGAGRRSLTSDELKNSHYASPAVTFCIFGDEGRHRQSNSLTRGACAFIEMIQIRRSIDHGECAAIRPGFNEKVGGFDLQLVPAWI